VAASPGDALLEAETLTFAYGTGSPVVDGVSLTIQVGERLALVGPNGAGKTTLLRLLSGDLIPRSGAVRWRGMPLAALGRRHLARGIAVLPQNFPAGPLDDLTVEEVVALGRTAHAGWLGLRGETAADRKAIAEALEATGSQVHASRRLAALSGGERQRAFLAMALAQQPDLLLLDEPTRHLDPHHQVALLGLVAELSRTRRLAAVAILHDLTLAAWAFPRIVLLDRGRVVADGSPAAALTDATVSHAYGPGLWVVAHPTQPDVPIILPAPWKATS
jgi:iron complex transport system ATP-binding protein